MTTSLVTGAAGFIGSHLVDALLQKGDRVIGIDHFNDYYDPNLKRKNISQAETHPNFQLIEADINTLNWRMLLEEVDVVYHQAAQAGVRASWGEGFRLYTERNVNATQVILEAAKYTPSLKRLVFASSSSIYGDAETLPTTESLCPRPVSPYGITKLAGEQLCRLYHQNFGVPTVTLRYFTVYGPRQRPDMAFHRFLKAALEHQPINIYGDGQQTRDFTFVRDVVAANLAAAIAPSASGQVFNIGGGSRVALTDIIDTLERITQMPIHRDYQEKARGDARHTAADTTQAHIQLGYTPQVSLEEGLAQEWHWLQALYR